MIKKLAFLLVLPLVILGCEKQAQEEEGDGHSEDAHGHEAKHGGELIEH